VTPRRDAARVDWPFQTRHRGAVREILVPDDAPGCDDERVRADLELLLGLYVVERETDSNLTGTMITLLTAAVGLIALAGVLLIRRHPPVWAGLVAPLAPIPFVALGALLVGVAHVRSRLLAGYEAEILAHRRTRLPGETDFSEPIRQVWRGWYGTTLIIIAFLALLGLYGGILAGSYEVLSQRHQTIAILGVTLCGLLMVVISFMYAAALRPHLIVGSALRRRSHAADRAASSFEAGSGRGFDLQATTAADAEMVAAPVDTPRTERDKSGQREGDVS
jgi:hypothetical protein